MGAFLADCKYGVRMLFKHPALAAVSILAFGLGLGLTTMMWSINYGALLRGLPFKDADRIMWVGRTNPERHIDRTTYPVLDFDAIRASQTSFVDLAGYTSGTINISGTEGRPERYRGSYVTPNLFGLLGVRPLLGRFFTADEGTVGGPMAVILGYDLWHDRFHSDDHVIGRSMRINGQTATIVGVMPHGFKFPILDELWVPSRIDRLKETRDNPNELAAVGVLKPGVSVDRAMQDLAAIEARLRREYPRTNRGMQPYIERFSTTVIGEQPRTMLWTMMGAVLGVLLIACSNVANLLLARAAARTKEVAVRTALGASRWRIVSQLLTEALVLSSAGALLGIAIAFYGVHWFNGALGATQVPFWIHIRVDGAVLAFTGAVTLLAALVSGVLPALQATGGRINEVLKDESRGASSMRLGAFSRLLVIVEIALSGALLIGAGFMIESVVTLSRFNYGVPTRDVFTARVGLFESTYPDSAARARFWNQVLDRLEARPGQQGVALTDALPGTTAGTSSFVIEGRTYASARDTPTVRTAAVSRGYFQTFRLHPLAGRVFTAEDAAATAERVAVVTRNLETKYFPGASAVGHRVRLGADQPWLTIVGVIPDVWYQGTDDDTPEALLTPLEQADRRFLTIAVNAGPSDPAQWADIIRSDVAAVDPDQPIYFADTLARRIADEEWFYSVFGSLFVAFGAAALLLATIGVYGVMSFAVSRRTQEVGVRMALGAGTPDVLRLFLRQGAAQVGVGLVLALGVAFGLARGIRFVLFQVDTGNPWMFAGVLAALAATGLVATLIPAMRATRVDPVVSLRYD